MKNKLIKKALAFPVSLCMIFPNVLGVYAVNNEMPENYPVSVQSNETSKHTYTVRYHLDGSDKVKEVTKTVAAESYSSTLYSRPFQVEDTKTRLEQGYKWIGWSTKENATEAEYTLGQKVTMTAENPELDLYSVYAPLDQAEFNVVVMYKDGETTTLSKATKASVTCKNWSISHPESGSMHESTVKEVYEAATKAASIKTGYKLKGMALNDKGELEEINASRIDFSKNSTFYLVAEKIPNTTYTVRYHLDGSDKVKEVTKTVAAESYSSTLYSRPFQVEDTKTRLEQGYKWIGWSTKENATEAEYTLGQKVTITAENPELDLYSVYAPLDQAEFNVVVMYKDGETTTLSKATKASVTCKNWSISHPESGSMHESTVKEVYEAATKAASIKTGYKLKGMALNDKGELEEINTSRIDFSKNSTFYLVAEKVEEVIEPGNKDEDKNNQDTSKDEIKTDVKNDDSNKKQEQGSVKTGDQTALLLNVSLCILSLLVILSLNRKMKKY